MPALKDAWLEAVDELWNQMVDAFNKRHKKHDMVKKKSTEGWLMPLTDLSTSNQPQITQTYQKQGSHRPQTLPTLLTPGELLNYFKCMSFTCRCIRQGIMCKHDVMSYLFNVLAEMVTRETLNGFQGGLQIGGRMITNLRYADDIILLASSEVLMDRLDRVSCKYSLLINVDKTKVMVSDGIACRILIQNELLEQVDTFPYLGPLITEDGECMTEFHTRLNKGQAIGASLQKMWKSHSILISTKIRLMKVLAWPAATYGCESWTLIKNEETRFDVFEMKGRRRILKVS